MKDETSWLGTVFNLSQKNVSPCNLLNNGGGVLLTRQGAETQTGHSGPVDGNEDSAWHLLTVTDEMSGHLYFITGSHVYVH